MNVKYVTDAFNDMVSVLKKYPKELAVDFSKIMILSMIAGILLGVVLVGGAFALGFSGLVSGEPNYVILAAGFLFGIIMLIAIGSLTTALSATMYPALVARTQGKKISIIQKTRELFVPLGKYFLVVLLGEMLVLALILLPILLQNWIITAIFAFVLIIVAVIIVFLIQFATLEIIFNKRGVIEALSRSAKLAKKNWVQVLVYDIVVFLIAAGIGIAFQVLTQIMTSILVLGIINPAFFAAGILIILLITFVQSIAISLVTVPFGYFFWRKLA